MIRKTSDQKIRPGSASSQKSVDTMSSDSNSINSRPSTGRKGSSASFSNERMALQTELSNDSLLRIISNESVKSSNDILLAAESGEIKIMKSVIKAGIDLMKCKGMDGYSCLHYAASRGHVAVIHILLQASFPVNILSDANETALHVAVYNGNITIVEQLLDYGANIDARNRYGETPLFYAVRKSMPAIIRLLLQRGADIMIEDNIGDRAKDHTDYSRIHALFDSTISPRSVSLYGVSISTTMPNHLLREIFSFLQPKEVGMSAQVCGKWHRVSESEEIWHRLGIRRWEYALHSALGFGIAPAESFKRSSTSSLSSRSK